MLKLPSCHLESYYKTTPPTMKVDIFISIYFDRYAWINPPQISWAISLLKIYEHPKGWMTRQFFWLIRISMSPNLPESSYNAIDTAEVPLNRRWRWRNWYPLKNVFKRAEPNWQFMWRIISQVWWLVNGQALNVDHFLAGCTESVPIFGTPNNLCHIPKIVHKRAEWV